MCDCSHSSGHGKGKTCWCHNASWSTSIIECARKFVLVEGLIIVVTANISFALQEILMDSKK